MSRPGERSLATLLRGQRAKLGLSQIAIAYRLDVNQATVSQWENGARLPGIMRLRGMSRVYRIPVSTLLAAIDADRDAARVARDDDVDQPHEPNGEAA